MQQSEKIIIGVTKVNLAKIQVSNGSMVRRITRNIKIKIRTVNNGTVTPVVDAITSAPVVTENSGNQEDNNKQNRNNRQKSAHRNN